MGLGVMVLSLVRFEDWLGGLIFDVSSASHNLLPKGFIALFKTAN